MISGVYPRVMRGGMIPTLLIILGLGHQGQDIHHLSHQATSTRSGSIVRLRNFQAQSPSSSSFAEQTELALFTINKATHSHS